MAVYCLERIANLYGACCSTGAVRLTVANTKVSQRDICAWGKWVGDTLVFAQRASVGGGSDHPPSLALGEI